MIYCCRSHWSDRLQWTEHLCSVWWDAIFSSRIYLINGFYNNRSPPTLHSFKGEFVPSFFWNLSNLDNFLKILETFHLHFNILYGSAHFWHIFPHILYIHTIPVLLSRKSFSALTMGQSENEFRLYMYNIYSLIWEDIEIHILSSFYFSFMPEWLHGSWFCSKAIY